MILQGIEERLPVQTSAENEITYKIWDDMTCKKTAMKKAQKHNSGEKESAEGQGCPSHSVINAVPFKL